MDILVQRFIQTKKDTIGKLLINGKFFCYTIEDVYRKKKIDKETRISAGIYKLNKREEGNKIDDYRRMFGKNHYMLWLMDVPNFEYVYIHVGNTNKDTEGCILVGDNYIENPEGSMVTNSKLTYRSLWAVIDRSFKNNEEITVEIRDEEKHA